MLIDSRILKKQNKEAYFLFRSIIKTETGLADILDK